MRANAVILIILGLLLLVGTAGAYIQVNVVGNQSWLVAGSGSSAAYTLTVTNTSGNVPISGATITFSVNPAYGTMSPSGVTTDSNGMASSTFTVNTTSGTALILASISYTGSNGPFEMTQPIPQKIDHNRAYYVSFTHPLSGVVGTEVPFTASLTDQWGNKIDNRRGNHIISLHVAGPAPDDSGFVEAGYENDITRILDVNGTTSVQVRLTSKMGDNNIVMDGYESIPNQYEWVYADAKGAPVLMTYVVSPTGSPPQVPADGTSYFTITYSLFDVYGNPTNNQSIYWSTSVPGEEKTLRSNYLGQIVVPYGPRSTIGDISITATAVANATVTAPPLTVRFTSTKAAIISLTANPDTLPSHDVPPSTQSSNIIATVADESGNAAQGETVTFSIEDITYDGIYNHTADPSFASPATAITDIFGQAKVQLTPGSFTIAGNPGYNASATGRCNVVATWNGTNKTVPVTWKNYPYLSISTSVSPLTVGINNTIDVTISLTGDGWAMQPTPIDAMLVFDRSGSMGREANRLPSGVLRMDAAKNASKTFVTKLNPGTDRVGLVSYSYENSVTLDAPLGTPFATINAKIDSLTSDGGTAMREGFRKSIEEMVNKPKPSALRAVILMTDGNWNNGGSPLAVGKGYQDIPWVTTNRAIDVGGSRYNGFSSLAVQYEDEDYRWYPGMGGTIITGNNVQVVRKPVEIDETSGVQTSGRTYQTLNNVPYCANGKFTQQNMSEYAKANNIRLYTLTFASTVPTSERDGLITLANSTGGFYRHAPSEQDLANVYAEIARDLQDTAGVNITMKADFEKINITGNPMNGSEVYDYVYSPPASTKINWQNNTVSVIDQSLDWADNKLDFAIGTIKVNEKWNATFRLKVKQPGLIEVFGNNSQISFNGGTQTLVLPQTFITVVPGLNVTNVSVKTITLNNLLVTAPPGVIKVLLPVTWTSTYTGNKTLTEQVKYCIDKSPNYCKGSGSVGSQWVQFDKKTIPGYPTDPVSTDYTGFAQLDVTKLPAGNYQIMVYATADDAADAHITLLQSVEVGDRGRTFIKLE